MIAVLICVVAFAGCSKGATAPSVVSVVVAGPSRVLVGDTARLSASALDANGVMHALPTVTWQSSAPGIASVSPAGVMTGLAAGSAEITALASGNSGRRTIAVDSGLVRLTGPASVYLGDTASIAAIVVDASGTPLSGRTVTWQSSAPNVATVSADGRVTSTGLGSTVITAAAAGGTGKFTLAVVAPASVAISGNGFLNVGDTTGLTAVAHDSTGAALSGREVAWQSSNPSAATVSGAGRVTAVGPGHAEITATIAGRTERFTVVVLTLYSDQNWAALNDWEIASGGLTNPRLTTLADAPFPEKTVLQYTEPAGMLGGGGGGTPGPASANFFFPRPPFLPGGLPTEILVGAWIKVGSPYQPPPSLGQKLWYFQEEDRVTGNAGFLWVEYSGTADDAQVILVNQMAASTILYAPNVTRTRLTAGTWHHYEVYFQQPNTATSNDGVVKVWIDGALNISVSNVSGLVRGSRGIDSIHQNMQWGGGGVVLQDQYIWATHNRVSGR